MSLRRETRAAAGFAFGLLGFFLAYVHRGGALLVPFALLGAALLLGSALAVRERPRPRSFIRRAGRVGATGAGALTVFMFFVLPVSGGIWLTQAPRERVDPAALGIPHENVTLRTRDGLDLVAWYVPSRNGSAVVVVHGGGGTRAGSARHARMLARAGYGVLLYDARGNGESDGRHDAMGWSWEGDVNAAVDFLTRRPDVERGRIGALGLSTGAEVVLEAAASDDRIEAVVADGAMVRTLKETRLLSGREQVQAVPYTGLMVATVRLVTGYRQPPPVHEVLPRIAPRSVLLVSAGTGVERTMNRAYHRRAPETRLWELPGAGHTLGLRDRPQAYSRTVLAFLGSALLD